MNNNNKLPTISNQFIKEFVERQGKDVDVLVEVKDWCDYEGEELWEITPDWRIVINPDNTVNLIFK